MSALCCMPGNTRMCRIFPACATDIEKKKHGNIDRYVVQAFRGSFVALSISFGLLQVNLPYYCPP